MSHCLATMLVSVCVLDTTTNTVRADYQMPAACMVVAHRGFSHIAPENTLAAAKKAVEIGADGSEFDVYASADGALVVMHDATVDRTTNGKGDVTKLSLAQIQRLDAGSWMDRRFAGERVPTLDQMLAVLRVSRCRPVIEIKGHDIADKVVAAVRAADMVDQAVVISFHKEAVKAVRTLEPRLACGWLCDKVPEDVPPSKQVDWIIGQARECDTNFVDLSHELLSAKIVTQLQRRGMTVWVWTVDDPTRIDELIRWGVAGVTTNRPDVVQQRLHAAAQEMVCSTAASSPRVAAGKRRGKARGFLKERDRHRMRGHE